MRRRKPHRHRRTSPGLPIASTHIGEVGDPVCLSAMPGCLHTRPTVNDSRSPLVDRFLFRTELRSLPFAFSLSEQSLCSALTANYISLLKQRPTRNRSSLVDDFDHFVSHFN